MAEPSREEVAKKRTVTKYVILDMSKKEEGCRIWIRRVASQGKRKLKWVNAKKKSIRRKKGRREANPLLRKFFFTGLELSINSKKGRKCVCNCAAWGREVLTCREMGKDGGSRDHGECQGTGLHKGKDI